MEYYSLNRQSQPVSFKEAVTRGIAPDKGLYFPESVTPLPDSFFERIEDLSHVAIAQEVIAQFVGDEIPSEVQTEIVTDVLSFDFPLVSVTNQISVLELFHGPTMAFKDVGARFMARCLGYFSSEDNSEGDITVLVATSGDTGGAVARGFYNVPGVNVVILYPSGRVSEIQEKQLTTLGGNITALEVSGSFDDCQKMVKDAFLDSEITEYLSLTSANSINVARWLPQMFYYFFAYKALADKNMPLVISVPSGNFGNICAGLMARKLGLPVDHFVAAVNANDVIPKYMETATYRSQPSVVTISNAMDVGDPSNFVRILELFEKDYDQLTQVLSSYSFSDAETREAMKKLRSEYGYLADPHGAVGYLGLTTFLKERSDYQGIFLETAHPVKFLDEVRSTLNVEVSLPEQISVLMDRKKKSTNISAYRDMKEFLLNT